MCATKLHGAKSDGPAVARLSFFAIRWRTKLYPETIFKVRSGLFKFVLFFLIKQKCVKSVCVNYCRFLSEAAACTPGGLSVCNEVARSENRRSRACGAVVVKAVVKTGGGGPKLYGGMGVTFTTSP